MIFSTLLENIAIIVKLSILLKETLQLDPTQLCTIPTDAFKIIQNK